MLWTPVKVGNFLASFSTVILNWLKGRVLTEEDVRLVKKDYFCKRSDGRWLVTDLIWEGGVGGVSFLRCF